MSVIRMAGIGAAVVLGAAGVLAATPGRAAVLTLTTSGTIVSGTDSSGSFGAPGSLAGDGYSLTLSFAGLGDSTFASSSAIDTSGSVPGAANVTIGGRTVSVAISNSYAAFLEETGGEIYATNNGDDGMGDIVSVTNAFTTSTTLPVDFATGFSRTGTASDLASNAGQVTMTLSGGLGTFNFTATPMSALFQVPEPASLGLLLGGLAALGLRRRA